MEWDKGFAKYRYLASMWNIRLFNRCCDICKDFRVECLERLVLWLLVLNIIGVFITRGRTQQRVALVGVKVL